jgi:hypothetical protein
MNKITTLNPKKFLDKIINLQKSFYSSKARHMESIRFKKKLAKSKKKREKAFYVSFKMFDNIEIIEEKEVIEEKKVHIEEFAKEERNKGKYIF